MGKRKVQLHSTTGKCKSLPKATMPQSVPLPVASTPSTSSVSTVLDGDPNSEQAQKFELELCWCIQQLQSALKNGKLNPKQMEEQRKVLNTLMSSSSPIIKKRQVMRMTFGDYRAKMEAEAQKYKSQTVATKIKVEAAVPSKKSVFVKKSLCLKSSNDFKFNFDTPKQDVPDVSAISISDVQGTSLPNKSEDIVEDQKNIENFSFVPSKNEFKFNFQVSES